MCACLCMLFLSIVSTNGTLLTVGDKSNFDENKNLCRVSAKVWHQIGVVVSPGSVKLLCQRSLVQEITLPREAGGEISSPPPISLKLPPTTAAVPDGAQLKAEQAEPHLYLAGLTQRLSPLSYADRYNGTYQRYGFSFLVL